MKSNFEDDYKKDKLNNTEGNNYNGSNNSVVTYLDENHHN